jgi:lysophospholipase L1-like esterase
MESRAPSPGGTSEAMIWFVERTGGGMNRRFVRGFISLIGLSIVAFAQAPAAKPLSRFEQWRNSRTSLYMNDFGELGRYREANAQLKPPSTGENRVVFYGDSITDGWPIAEYFPGKPYINRGISGQTTSQMLVRFRQDVIALQPKAVVILAGTNDIAGNTGPISVQDIEGNYASIAELAHDAGIKVVYSSVLPVHNYTPESKDFFSQRPPEKIVELNHWLKAYCAAHDCIYLDYFSAMVDGTGLLRKELAVDGLHPNKAGYQLMAPMAEAAIAKALGSQ